jgi:hypothetical protein
MRLRILYALVGAVWGLLAGLALAFELAGLMAGVSWLFLFGDDPWPETAGWYILAGPLAVGAGALVACTAFGFAYGRRQETAAPRAVRRKGGRLLALGLGLWLALGFGAAIYQSREREARIDSTDREAAFEELRAASRTVGAVEPMPEEDGTIWVRIETEGARDGGYLLTWRLEEPTYRIDLLAGEREVRLSAGEPAVELALDLREIGHRYRAEVLHGSQARVLVDATLRLHLALEPRLDAGERARLPQRELGNLDRGFSQLRVETRAEIPVALDLAPEP